MKLPSTSTYGYWLGIIRIFTGVFWLMHGVPKFTQSAGFMPPNGMMLGFINHQSAQTSGPYQTFLTGVVVPHAWLFANLVRFGEVIGGCLLLLGFYTRLGGLIGMLLTLNYIGAKGGFEHASVWAGIDGAALALSFISFVLPTGRFLGVDGVLYHLRRPRRPKAQPEAVFVEEPPMTGPTAPPT